MSDFTMSAHPSTITNNNSLNGNDTSTGGSMNMPIDISVELTTRSMIRNGTNTMNPMMNAVLISDSTNAGMSAARLTSERCFGGFEWLALMNRLSSPWRVSRSMKSFSGFCAASHD